MTDAKRFRQINGLARHREAQAGKVLSESVQAQRAEEQRLQQLQTYLEEYRQKFQHAVTTGLDARQLNDYQRFLSNLNLAIEQQRQILHGRQKSRDANEHQWREARTKVQALEKLVARQQVEARMQQERREQKNQDDHALRDYTKQR